ncbi:MAG: hypothetical protein LCH74_17695 [Proteobacteria bacterium]|jgi:hypothetical protein|uniref:hypothetical protein n=1 Tax=Sphingopyxis terrae TaxID=33052 RepID=UPI000786D143|nr:hypothetical protein [Sphingopyxis terrae]MCA0210897.1 hypothetical protein [Pseudomonadota bacterium]
MLRGIVGVVYPAALKPGQFYVRSDYAGGRWLALCVGAAAGDGGSQDRWELVFDRPDQSGPFLQVPSDSEPVALLPPVAVRVDPVAAAASPYIGQSFKGQLLVAGHSCFVIAPFERGIGRATIDLASGMQAATSLPDGWLGFSDWSLVVGDGDEEKILMRYGGSD